MVTLRVGCTSFINAGHGDILLRIEDRFGSSVVVRVLSAERSITIFVT